MSRNVMLFSALLLAALPAGAVTFTDDTHIPDGDATYDGQILVVDNCTVTINGAHTFAGLNVADNGKITHSEGICGLWLTVTGTIAVSASGSIDVSERGQDYLPGTSGNSGGSYGGRGHESNGSSCPTFGDAFCPTNMGSGGTG